MLSAGMPQQLVPTTNGQEESKVIMESQKDLHDNDSNLLNDEKEPIGQKPGLDRILNDDVFTQAKMQVTNELTRAAESSRFNPNPDETKVRQLRSGYAKLLGEVRSKRGDLIQAESTRLVDMLGDANELLGHVHTTVDATLDSRFMALSADLGAEKMNKLAAGSIDFGLGDFCSLAKAALMRSAGPPALLLGSSLLTSEADVVNANASASSSGPSPPAGDQYNWKIIGELALRHWRGVSTLDFMLGPITVEPKEKKGRVRAPRQPKLIDEPIVQPIIIDDKQAALPAATETTNNVIRVYGTLVEVTPIPFYQFIIHPNSFARTVENLYYVSFLINDNRIRLERKEGSAELVLNMINDDKDEDETEEGWAHPKHQAIYTITMKVWREMIEKYQIIQPMIPF